MVEQNIASVVELVYTSDLKSDGLTAMRVQVPPLAPRVKSVVQKLKRLSFCRPHKPPAVSQDPWVCRSSGMQQGIQFEQSTVANRTLTILER